MVRWACGSTRGFKKLCRSRRDRQPWGYIAVTFPSMLTFDGFRAVTVRFCKYLMCLWTVVSNLALKGLNLQERSSNLYWRALRLNWLHWLIVGLVDNTALGSVKLSELTTFLQKEKEWWFCNVCQDWVWVPWWSDLHYQVWCSIEYSLDSWTFS
jgi:hypothetical protein